jgi:pimeloyl-ACP methyl ester carboxylesterase
MSYVTIDIATLSGIVCSRLLWEHGPLTRYRARRGRKRRQGLSQQASAINEKSSQMSTDKYEFKEITQNVLEGWRLKAQRNTRAILFVHGFLGDPIDTWKASQEAASFPKLLVDDPDLDDFDIFTFRYKTGTFRHLRIDTIAQQMDNEIKSSLAGYQLVLLAHSLGGVVCMRYILNKLRDAVKPPVLGLLMYGTPTTGVEWINMLRLGLTFAGLKIPFLGLATKLLGNMADLETGSIALQDLQNEWILRVVNGGYSNHPADLRAWIPVRVVTGNEDWVVKEHSAKGVYGRIDWCPLDQNHRALVKPLGHNDARYKCAAEFFAQSRHSKPTQAVAKLRQASDWVWNLLGEKLVRDWTFRIHFYDSNKGNSTSLLLPPGFSICEVKQCQYTLVLPTEPMSLGMALGRVAAEHAWKIHNPIYVHGIRLDAVKREDGKAIAVQIRERLEDSGTAWDSFFQNAWMKVSELEGDRSYALVPGEVITEDDLVIRYFSIPEGAEHLIGKEVVLDLGFRSIRPSSLCEFTLRFKWLTHRCDAEVVVHGGTDFLVSSVHSTWTGFDIPQPEDLGGSHKLQVKTDDIVLPDSVVRVRWAMS